MLTNEYLDALEAQTRSVMESAQRLVEMIGIVRRMVDLDRAAVEVKTEVKTEVKEEEEDWDAIILPAKGEDGLLYKLVSALSSLWWEAISLPLLLRFR